MNPDNFTRSSNLGKAADQIEALAQRQRKARRDIAEEWGKNALRRVRAEKRAEELKRAKEVLEAERTLQAHRKFTEEVSAQIRDAAERKQPEHGDRVQRIEEAFAEGARRKAGVEPGETPEERRAKFWQEVDDKLKRWAEEEEEAQRRRDGVYSREEVDALIEKWEKSQR